ncbi:hypothetical protein A4G99_18770 [Haladaptatus sp. R4]|nr:hypothetical protein A4G99_18770 [Haladaptatus sp. R4]
MNPNPGLVDQHPLSSIAIYLRPSSIIVIHYHPSSLITIDVWTTLTADGRSRVRFGKASETAVEGGVNVSG